MHVSPQRVKAVMKTEGLGLTKSLPSIPWVLYETIVEIDMLSRATGKIGVMFSAEPDYD